MTRKSYSDASREERKVAIYSYILNTMETSHRKIGKALDIPKSTVFDMIGELLEEHGGRWWNAGLDGPIDTATSHQSLEWGGIQKLIDVASSPKSVSQVLEEREIDTDKYGVEYATFSDDFEKSRHRTFVKVVPKTVTDAPKGFTLKSLRPNPAPAHTISSMASDKDVKKCLVFGDTHVGYRNIDGQLVPFHDRAALDIVKQVSREFDFDSVVHIGDLLDLPEISKFRQEPSFQNMVQPAIYEAGWLMEEMPECDRIFIPGNHDERWERFILENASHMFGLENFDGEKVFTIESLLGLEKGGWQVSSQYPNGRHWLNDNYALVHGEVVGAAPGATVAKMLGRSKTSFGQGHTHRLEQAFDTIFDRDGFTHITASNFGYLGKQGPEGPPSQSERKNWHQGFGIVYYNDKEFHVVLCPIYNGKALVMDRVFYGDEVAYVKELNQAFDGWEVTF